MTSAPAPASAAVPAANAGRRASRTATQASAAGTAAAPAPKAGEATNGKRLPAGGGTAPGGQGPPAASGTTPAATPAMDLPLLEQRLKDTHAIGLFTKLSLKNQVDDLLTAVRAYHQGRLATSLTELRQRYDLLMMKVLSLLQDGDPQLAMAISASREAIWGILRDPAKLSAIS